MTQANFQPDSNQQVIQMLSAINSKISSMDSKIEKVSEEIVAIKITQAETNGKIDTVKAQMTGLEEKFDQRFETVEAKITGLERKFEQKFETVEVRIAGLDNRLGQAEFINRGVLVSLTVAIIGGVAKLIFG